MNAGSKNKAAPGQAGLEENIGYRFKNAELAQTALTHTSYANEAKKQISNNERLEFLGDSVLSVVVADYLFHSCRHLPEGELTRKRASLVCEPALDGFARRIQLGNFLLLGKGEEMSGGRERASILSNAFEALIAAIYLDGGMEAARAFILPFVTEGTAAEEDYKTRLQEVVQQNPEERLRYVVVAETGPDHNKSFVVEVHLNSNCIGRGEGHSKKLAEQHAARQALVLMGLEKEG
ncbi:MAG: ribonuclease III [Oscillospiraceae bacterium]